MTIGWGGEPPLTEEEKKDIEAGALRECSRCSCSEDGVRLGWMLKAVRRCLVEIARLEVAYGTERIVEKMQVVNAKKE